jgi:hypothetical protein
MATDLDNLTTRRSAIYAELAALSGTADDSPNVNGGGAGTVDHTGKIDQLYRELKELNAQIDLQQGPWELSLEGRPA